MTWSYSGEADRFDVNVGGRAVQVVSSARTATVTGNTPGTKTVTVTAVRGSVARSTSTTLTVGSTATVSPTATASPTATVSPTATASPTTTPPAAPTGVSGIHSGTSATVRFNAVSGATSYTIHCNRYGFSTITGTSGTVACGPESAGRTMIVGVQANNAAGSSEVVEVGAEGT